MNLLCSWDFLSVRQSQFWLISCWDQAQARHCCCSVCTYNKQCCLSTLRSSLLEHCLSASRNQCGVNLQSWVSWPTCAMLSNCVSYLIASPGDMSLLGCDCLCPRDWFFMRACTGTGAALSPSGSGRWASQAIIMTLCGLSCHDNTLGRTLVVMHMLSSTRTCQEQWVLVHQNLLLCDIRSFQSTVLWNTVAVLPCHFLCTIPPSDKFLLECTFFAQTYVVLINASTTCLAFLTFHCHRNFSDCAPVRIS